MKKLEYQLNAWHVKALFNTKLKNNTKLKKKNTKLRNNTQFKKNYNKFKK